MKRGFSALLIVVAVAIIAAVGYWYSQSRTVAPVSLEVASHGDSEGEWLYIEEWGIDIRKPAGVPDLRYAFSEMRDDDSIIGFSSERLVAAEGAAVGDTKLYCSAEAAPGGYLGRSLDPNIESDAWWADGAVRLGDYYYLFSTSQSACSDDPAIQALQSELKRGLNIQGGALEAHIRPHSEMKTPSL